MVVAAGLSGVLLNKAGLSIPGLLLATALLNAVVAIYIYTLVPEFLLRFVDWLLINTLYRIRAAGTRKHSRARPGAARLQPRQLHGSADHHGLRAPAGALRDVLQDLRNAGREVRVPRRQGDSDRRREGRRRDHGARLRRGRQGTGRRQHRLHLSRRRHHARRHDPALPPRHGTHPRATAGAGRAAGAARIVGQHLQPARFDARTHAPAATVLVEDRAGRRRARAGRARQARQCSKRRCANCAGMRRDICFCDRP